MEPRVQVFERGAGRVESRSSEGSPQAPASGYDVGHARPVAGLRYNPNHPCLIPLTSSLERPATGG